VSVELDRIKTISCSLILDNALSPKEVVHQIIEEIARGIAEKLMEFHKINTWDAGYDRTGYQSEFKIIVPPTPEKPYAKPSQSPIQ